MRSYCHILFCCKARTCDVFDIKYFILVWKDIFVYLNRSYQAIIAEICSEIQKVWWRYVSSLHDTLFLLKAFVVNHLKTLADSTKPTNDLIPLGAYSHLQTLRWPHLAYIHTVKCRYDIIYGTAITVAESESDFRITSDTPYLTLIGDKMILGENWLHYNSSALYMGLVLYTLFEQSQYHYQQWPSEDIWLPGPL